MTEEKQKILIVDDEKPIHELFEVINRRVLKGDYELCHAYNGQEGIEAYKQHKYRLIFTDNEMPVKKGLEASLEIKQEAEKNNHDVTVALMSSTIEKKDIPDCIDYFLRKPFEVKEAIEIIKKTYIKSGDK